MKSHPKSVFSTESSRRSFLRSSGLAALFAPVFLTYPEFAAAQAKPRRLVSIFLPNGYVNGCRFVTKDAAGLATLGPGHTPLQGLLPQATFFTGHSAERIRVRYQDDYGGKLSGHGEVAASLFTGHVRNPKDQNRFLAPSIDQIIASELIRTKAFPSEARKSLGILINGGAANRGSSVFAMTPANFALNGTADLSCAPLPLLVDPLEGFVALFGEAVATNPQTFSAAWGRHKSVLDEPREELARMAKQLPKDGQDILAAHLDALRALEAELVLGISEDFSAVPRPASLSSTQRASDPVKVFEEWSKVVDLAFRFDRTRVVSLEVGGSAARYRVPGVDLPAYAVDSEQEGTKHSDHHSYTHLGSVGVDGLYQYFRWYNERIAALAVRLRGGGDASKEDLLAQSLMFVTAESGRQHQARDMPTLLLGTCGGAVRGGGRVLDLGGADSSHLGFLVEIGRALGITNLSRLGNAAHTVTDLKGFLA